MPPPKAYFLTWTTYGTHLRGDAIESTDHARGSHGARRLPPSPVLLKKQSDALKGEPYRLSAASRATVDQAIREHAAFKNWRVFAVSVRTNHVHVLVNGDVNPEQMMISFKAWATRAMRNKELALRDQKIWTRHGSTRWINDQASFDAAYSYIVHAQDGPIAERRYSSKPLPPGRG